MKKIVSFLKKHRYIFWLLFGLGFLILFFEGRTAIFLKFSSFFDVTYVPSDEFYAGSSMILVSMFFVFSILCFLNSLVCVNHLSKLRKSSAPADDDKKSH